MHPAVVGNRPLRGGQTLRDELAAEQGVVLVRRGWRLEFTAAQIVQRDQFFKQGRFLFVRGPVQFGGHLQFAQVGVFSNVIGT